MTTNDRMMMLKMMMNDDEAKCINETAEKIIKSKVKEFLQLNATGSTTCYPSIDDIKIGWIPNHLRLCFSYLIGFKLKIETTGQCLMKAAMPRSH